MSIAQITELSKKWGMIITSTHLFKYTCMFNKGLFCINHAHCYIYDSNRQLYFKAKVMQLALIDFDATSRVHTNK